MDYNAESVATFNQHAALYAEKYFGLTDYDVYYDKCIAELRNRPFKFLDLACGPGNVAAYVRRHCPQAEILCVDKSPEMLAQVQQRVTDVEVLVEDCRDLTRIDARFDAAAFCFGLSYFDNADAAKVLAQLHQVLVPGASFVLATLAGDPTLTGAQATPTGDKVFSFYRNEKDIVHLLTAAGFRIEGSAVVSSPSNASVRSNDVVLWGKRQ